MGELDTFAGVAHSRMWHRALEAIEFGPVPVVSALHGAVVGGGLELAAATHLRVAERSTFYALPEGTRGLFVGGGGSVRLPRLIGVARMADMMLTGRRYDAEEGLAFGLSQYVVDDGAGLTEALALAERIAGNAPQTNFAVVQALPRIAEANPREGYLLEAMTAAVAQGTDDAKARMRAFLDGRAGEGDRPMNDQGIGSWPRRRARMTPAKPALVQDGTATTYAELDRRTTRLAHGLRARGVDRGDRVAFLGLNSVEFVTALFATARLGAVFVPVNTRLAGPEVGYILGHSQTAPAAGRGGPGGRRRARRRRRARPRHRPVPPHRRHRARRARWPTTTPRSTSRSRSTTSS